MRSARTLSRSVRSIVLMAAVLLPGCSSDSNPPVTSTPPPPTTLPPTTQTVVQSGSGSLPVLNLALIPFSISSTGRLDVTVDWTFASNDVDVYLVRGACTFDQFINLGCNIIAFSESGTAKPERVSSSGATAGSYFVAIGNLGPTDESVAFQVVLTTGPGVSSVTGASAAGPARALRGEYKAAAPLGR